MSPSPSPSKAFLPCCPGQQPSSSTLLSSTCATTSKITDVFLHWSSYTLNGPWIVSVVDLWKSYLIFLDVVGYLIGCIVQIDFLICFPHFYLILFLSFYQVVCQMFTSFYCLIFKKRCWHLHLVICNLVIPLGCVLYILLLLWDLCSIGVCILVIFNQGQHYGLMVPRDTHCILIP